MAVDWEDVYRSTFPDLVRYLHRKVWDADRARDLAQEAFARSLRREPEDPRSWSLPSPPTWRGTRPGRISGGRGT